jgi:tight adherence protein C
MFMLVSTLSTLVLGFVIFKSRARFYEIDKIAEYICSNYTNKAFGDCLKIRNEVKKFSALDDNAPIIIGIIKRNCKLYLIIWITFSIIALTLSFINLISKDQITYLIRPEVGSNYHEVSIMAEAEIQGEKINEEVTIKINPKAMSEEMQITKINEFIKSIPDVILDQNNSMQDVSTPLNLIKYDQGTGIQIEWESNNPNLIDSEGFVNSINIIEPMIVELRGTFKLMNTEIEKIFSTRVINNKSITYISKIFDKNIQTMVKKISLSNGNEYIFLPEIDSFGNNLFWSKGNDSYQSKLFILLIISLAVIYFNRHTFLAKKTKKFKDDIIKDFPSFVTKFILLLNAGLVVSTALEKIAFDYESNIRNQGIIPIYEELLIIEYKIFKTKSSLLIELKNLGERTKIREMSRFAAIISENINNGSELVDKLEIEGELLWINRKKRIEERARLTETKLTFPLLILLIVLIALTISPVLITFN